MQREYVEICNGAYYVAGSRVSLASIIYEYRDGAAAETIRQNFPTRSLEQIHGAIASYLGHQEEAEAYLGNLETILAADPLSSGSGRLKGGCTRLSPKLVHRRINDARCRGGNVLESPANRIVAPHGGPVNP